MPTFDRLSLATAELREFARAGLRVDSFGRRLQLIEGAPVLSALPAVRAAGGDATARFEYLVQAVIDAIDDLSRTGIDPAAAVGADHPEAIALRQLFGLTDRTRRASWRTRQDAAATSLHVSWDHFRHSKQNMLLRALTERLLANADGHREKPQTSFAAFPSQREAEADLVAYIHDQRPARADLLELSTATMLPVIRALRDVGTDVRLLVANPAILLATPFMNERIRSALADLFGEVGGGTAFEVRAYNVPPSLRGRSIGSLIAVGWYTYRDNKRLDEAEGATTEIWGHDNAVIVGDVTDASAATLAGWFAREFDRLWAHRLTQDASVLRQR